MGGADGAGGVIGNVAIGSTLGVDTIATFESYFYDPGFNTNGIHQYTWQFRMAAINGAYSYPDQVLTTPSVSRNPDCK